MIYMDIKMKNEKLEHYEDKFTTKIGIVNEGHEGYIFDKNVSKNISNMDYFEYQIYSTSGIEIKDKELLEIFKYLTLTTSYTDIRIWPNRIAAYGGSVQTSRKSALSAALACTESIFFGHLPVVKCYYFLKEIKKQLEFKNLESIIKENIDKKRIFYGFGRPNSTIDERGITFKKKLEDFNSKKIKNILLIFKIQEILKTKFNKNININQGGIVAAFAFDLGLNIEQVESIYSFIFTNTMVPPYDYVKNNMPVGTFLPFRSEDIIYEGEHILGRKWDE